MHPEGKDKIALITDDAIYYYQVIPFGLKSARATFQRMVDEIFKDLIRKTMEICVDDMLVKSLNHTSHMKLLKEAFALL